MWISAIVLLAILPAGFVVDQNAAVLTLITINIAGFFVIYWVIRRLTRRMHVAEPRVRTFQAAPLERELLRRFMVTLLIFWAPLYVLTIVSSGGMPIVWLLTDSSKTYTDFGVASVSGLLNMIRAFIFSAGVLLYLVTGRLRELALPTVLLVLCIGEVSRGGILVLLLHGSAIYVLCRRISLGRLLKFAGFAVAMVIAFGVLGQFRGASVDATDFVNSGSAFTSLPLGFFFAFTYLVSPLNNLYYGADTLTPLLYPYYSVQPLLPTVVREVVFGVDAALDRYPIALYIDSFNATSFYGPLLADFGFAGAGIAVTLIQIATAWCHVMARRGSLIHFLIYPALFMSVVLSVFYMYFFALIVVLYPLLAYGFRYFRRRILRRAVLRASRARRDQRDHMVVAGA